MSFRYCPVCSMELIKKEINDEGLIPFCENCNKPYFFLGKLCVLVAVINENKEIVLTKQKHISEDKWILISGYVKQGETIEDTIVREVKEEIGQEVVSLKYIKSYFFEHGDMLMLGFAAFVKHKSFILSDEINEINWFDMKEASERIFKHSIAEQLLNDIRTQLNM